MAVRYEFYYETPTSGTDPDGNPITVNIPTTFSLGGVSLDVVKGIRRGLRAVPTITNVAVSRWSEVQDTIVDTTP